MNIAESMMNAQIERQRMLKIMRPIAFEQRKNDTLSVGSLIDSTMKTFSDDEIPPYDLLLSAAFQAIELLEWFEGITPILVMTQQEWDVQEAKRIQGIKEFRSSHQKSPDVG